MSLERDICKRVDVNSTRHIDRISIICKLIKDIWLNYRNADSKIGFFYITNLIEIEAAKDGDTFYWEEDRWYDKLKEISEKSSQFEKQFNLSLKEQNEINEVVDLFKDYWKEYCDLRFAQIIELFNIAFEARIREVPLTNKNFWKEFFSLEEEDLKQIKKI